MNDYLFSGGVAAKVLSSIVVFIATWIAYVIGLGIYNLTLHPLRSYPGPLLWRAYRLPFALSVLAGRLPFDALELHKKYGHVVRVAPNELSYTDSQALKPIYGYHNPATEGFIEFAKDRIEYQNPEKENNNIIATDAVTHGRLRRLLSHAFSEKGMRDMQPRIQSYVDLLIEGLREASGNYINIVEWYNWTTFDIIGDLALGEQGHALERKETNAWIASKFGAVKASSFMILARHYGLSGLIPYIVPKHLMEKRRLRREQAKRQIEERLKLGSNRGDFWDNVIEKSDFEKGTGMTTREMESNAATLLLGGSETTATLLSGTTYFLLKHQDVMKKLQDEVRNAFKHEDEIDLISVGKLDYMLAVLDEGLRVFPPVPKQGNRVVPRGGAMVAGKWVPGGTSLEVQQYAANHSPANFTRPEDFVPERWYANPPAEFANDDLAARAPFSLGPRNCIGRNLAYAEMRLVLARIIFNFDLELDQKRCANWFRELKIFILWEKRPLWVKMTPVGR